MRRLDDLPQALHDDITALQALMTEALVDVRTDGLFVSYAGYETSGAPAFRRIPRELFGTA